MASSFFGSVNQNANSNYSLIGGNNTGLVSNNSNLKVQSTGSTLNIVNNSNCKFTVQSSHLTAESCSNSDISGQGNKLVTNDNSNLKFRGDNNEAELNSNSNFNLSGNNGLFNFWNNSNTTVTGNDNNIQANNNSNLKVENNGNRLQISETSNHLVKILDSNITGDGISNNNMLQVIPNPNGQLCSGSSTLWVSSWLGGGSWQSTTNSLNEWNLQFSINYLNQASINKNMYEVGIFKFKLEEGNESGGSLNVRLEDSELDPGGFNVSCSGSDDKCVVTGTKGGEKQKLLIVGPLVRQLSDSDPKLLCINFRPRAAL